VNLSQEESRLVFPRAGVGELAELGALKKPTDAGIDALRAAEQALGYHAPSGRYWEILDQIDATKLSEIDARWLALYRKNYSP
jgi:hypothetical protein